MTSRRSVSSSPSRSRLSSSSTNTSASSLNEKSPKVVAITGGSGVLGSQVAKLIYNHWRGVEELRLFDCRPPDVTLITSITGYAAPPDKPKVSYHPGSVLNNDSLMCALVKADVVIHCAAVVENGSVLSRRRMKEVNVDGTQRVVQACLECGVRALVFTGSLCQVLSIPTHKKPVRYTETLEQHNNRLIFPYYGGSKNEAENLVLLANDQEGKDGVKLYTCSLRCPVMFGEGDTLFVVKSLQMAKRCYGYFVPVGLFSGSGTTMQSLYVGNGAWAHVLAAQRLFDEDTRLRVGGKFYYIGDHSPICSLTNFFSQFLNPFGYRVLPVGVPFILIFLVAYLVEFLLLLLAFVKIDVRSSLTRSSLNMLKINHSFSWEKARDELQYVPLYSNKTALARSMEYYRKVL